jgi:nucleotide-binding universal stress UspA family protein
MQTFRNSAPVSHAVAANGTHTQPKPVYKRLLVPIDDASQIEHVAELARRAGASEARVLHLNLHEYMGGRRFAIETESSAARVVEAAVLEFSMAGIEGTGHVLRAPIDKAAEAIVAEATQWGADLIVLGSPRRRVLATRLFGSVTLRVLLHAPCPVLVASAVGSDRLLHVKQGATAATA